MCCKNHAKAVMSEPEIQKALFYIGTSPVVSDWLRTATETALERDPLDALKDAELLTQILRSRFQNLIGQV